MIRLSIILAVAAGLSGCATFCDRDTPALAQSDRYGGIETAQEDCQPARRPVGQSELRSLVQ